LTLERVIKLIKSINGQIYFNQKYKTDLEWWILGKFCKALKKSQKQYPIYAKKRDTPDFETYDANRNLVCYYEVTEVLIPGRKRTDEYRSGSVYHKNYNPEKRNLNSLLERLDKKLICCYTKTNLLIYLNISELDISTLGVWHGVIFKTLKIWLKEDKLSFENCRFNNIYILDSNGERIFRIYPDFNLIYTFDNRERIYTLN